MHNLLIVTFVVVFIIEFVAYGMQRTVLLMSRESGLPYQIAETILPSWYPAVWLLRIAKWGILIFIVLSWSWIIAVGLLIADVIAPSVLPIPYFLYIPSFRRKLEGIKKIDYQSSQVLEAMLNEFNIHGS